MIVSFHVPFRPISQTKSSLSIGIALIFTSTPLFSRLPTLVTILFAKFVPAATSISFKRSLVFLKYPSTDAVILFFRNPKSRPTLYEAVSSHLIFSSYPVGFSKG